jgi:hypothetical protein
MDDHMDQTTDPGERELERRLDAYADARLTPTDSTTSRMRTSVMTAAHRRAALIEADATFDAADETPTALAAKRRAAGRGGWKRPLMAVFAGCLTLSILGVTTVAARPGGPLYAARLWTEMQNLPADLMARAEAEVQRLQDRIDEAQQAISAGDGPGTAAAMDAYTHIVVEAADGSDGNAAAASTIEVRLTIHVRVLSVMVTAVPVPARAAVEEALAESTRVLDDLHAKGISGGRPGTPIDIAASTEAPH